MANKEQYIALMRHRFRGDEIRHFGVKGMKWGVRKATTGASKLGKSDNVFTSAGKIVSVHGRVKSRKQQSKLKAKSKRMSSEELQAAVSRMRLENEYVNLQSKEVIKGRMTAVEYLEVAGAATSIIASLGALAVSLKALKDD